MKDWLAYRTDATPGAEGLVNAASGNSWNYATLDETAEEMAGRLAATDCSAGDHLGAALGTCVEHVCLVHAAMRLGVTLVPLSPEFTTHELTERFDRADVDAVVCDADTERAVVEAATDQSVVTVDDPQREEATSLSSLDPEPFTPHEWVEDDTQLLLFTSGTTGSPKVVRLTAGNLYHSAISSAFRLGVDPDDSWLVPLSLHHMGGIAPVLRSTLYGTTVVVRESFDAGRTVDDISTYDVTGVSLVPTMLRRMLEARGTLPDSLRFVLVGGAPCPAELVQRCRNFRVPVCPTYGMTETASQVATARPDEAYQHPETVGRPLFRTQVTVVDEDGESLPAGETGEFVVDGPTVTPGYYGNEAAAEEAFGPYGFHTGDVGYRDDAGRLYVLNRLDDRIVTGGENVDPGEVVDALQTHPDVEAASVVGLPDEEWGERVAALVVPTRDDLAASELEAHCRERLAPFKVPKTIGFTDALPRTVSGTVEREEVRERLLEDTADAIEEAETDVESEDEWTEAVDEQTPRDADTTDVREESAVGEQAEFEFLADEEAAGEGASDGEGATSDEETDDGAKWSDDGTAEGAEGAEESEVAEEGEAAEEVETAEEGETAEEDEAPAEGETVEEDEAPVSEADELSSNSSEDSEE